ncbi:MAG: beta-galactosidase [Anaerolineae bacterium]|nr:beta-galactosidase [Anaerolineae bacterium]
MSTFYAKDGQFWLNDQPQLIQAGEFHYFRAPVDQWAHRLDLLRRAGFNAVAAYIPWLWHQPESDISDVDGHTHPMRDLARFLDLAAEMGFWIIARPGPYIMAETINEGIPPWVFRQNPQASFVGQDGSVQNVASYLQPDFLRCVEGWYKAVFAVLTPRQITHDGKIIMIQLDNEMGMIQWVRNLIDTNPDTLARFAGYLQTMYGESLSRRYPAATLTDFLRDQIMTPQSDHGAMVIEDYRRFYRVYLREYADHLWARAKAYGMDTPPVVNIHGFGNGGKTFPIGLSQLVEVIEMDGMISATDVYPIFIGEGNFHQLVLVNEMTKALQNPQQALFSIEFQAGGNQDFGGAQASLYDLHSRLCISCGMRAINHYLFFDGENDPVLSPVKRHDWGHPVRKDGTLRSHYARYPQLSRVLAAYGADLVRSHPKTVTTLGFLLDDYMTEINNAFTRPATDLLTHQRDVILFDFLARGLAITHRPFNALELSRARLDVAEMPSLWVMMDKQCEAATQQKLAEYVRQGGKLILVGRLPDETFDHAPCTILRDALGLQVLRSDLPGAHTRLQAFGYSDVPVACVETYAGEFDEVFATSADGQAVGIIKRLGGGRVMVFGAALAANTLDDVDILHQMANRMECAPLFNLSAWADVRLSEGDNGNFLFINNYQDDPLETTITCAGKLLFGGSMISIPARRGAILPLEWQVKAGIVVHYATSEITAVSDEGAWLMLKTAQAEVVAELSLYGYHCDESLIVERIDAHRVKIQAKQDVIELVKANA